VGASELWTREHRMRRAGRREQGGGSIGALEEGAPDAPRREEGAPECATPGGGSREPGREHRTAPGTECAVSRAGRRDQRAPELSRREHWSSPEKRQGALEESRRPGPRAPKAAGKVGSTGSSRARDREHRRRTGPRAPKEYRRQPSTERKPPLRTERNPERDQDSDPGAAARRGRKSD
jgi:hypothetical protein